MKFLAAVGAIAGLASAVPAPAQTNNKGLEVSLELIGHSDIKATVKNSGNKKLRILKTASIIGEAPSKKVHVSSAEGTPDFTGGIVNVVYDRLPETAFVSIAPGESIDSTFDVAELYDMSKGGEFSIQGKGALEIAGDDNKVVEKATYETNTIKAKIDGAKAAKILSDLDALHKRAVVDGSCQGDRFFKLEVAYNNAHTQATVAANQARNGDAGRLDEFFKGSDGGTRDQVGGVFDRVAAQTYTLRGGEVHAYCTDPRQGCAGGGAAAVTYPFQSQIAYCDFFFDGSSDLNQGCHAQDRAEIVVHETTHTTQVAGTDDKAYFYDGIRGLNHQDALNNADTYGLYASSFWEDCYGANIAQVYSCIDANFQGACTGIRMPVGFCANVPESFNDQISSLGGSYTGICYGYVDGDCSGNALEIPNGHDAQLNNLGNFNDVFSSFRCV